jgi:hypothetical protein
MCSGRDNTREGGPFVLQHLRANTSQERSEPWQWPHKEGELGDQAVSIEAHKLRLLKIVTAAATTVKQRSCAGLADS